MHDETRHGPGDERRLTEGRRCYLCGRELTGPAVAGLRNGAAREFCSEACESTSTADAGDGFPVAPAPTRALPPSQLSDLERRLTASVFAGFCDGAEPIRADEAFTFKRDRSTTELLAESPGLHKWLRLGHYALEEHRRRGRGLRELAEEAAQSMTRLAWAMRLSYAEERGCLYHVGTTADPMTLDQAELAAGIAEPLAGLELLATATKRVGVWRVLDIEGGLA